MRGKVASLRERSDEAIQGNAGAPRLSGLLVAVRLAMTIGRIAGKRRMNVDTADDPA